MDRLVALHRTHLRPSQVVTTPIAPIIHAEIESPRPLRATDGSLRVTGWCFAEGSNTPPAVRLRVGTVIVPLKSQVDRSDVPRLFPDQAAAPHCGFVIECELPPGVYMAGFEAQAPDGAWHGFKTLSLMVGPRPLAVAVESPAGEGPLTARTPIEGWALHPDHPITELTLRYGHQDLPCDLGFPRADLSAQYPQSPHAGHAGFRTRTSLPAGVGPLRARARLGDGQLALARTSVQVAIPTDENHGPELDLHALRVGLPGYEQRIPPVADRTAIPLNLLFVLHGDFTANSTLQACALANELADAGHACVIAVPRDLETLRHQRAPRFRGCLHAEALEHGGAFANGRGPDVIHAWTTRERIRHAATAIQQRHGGRLCIHLEDNERELLAQAAGRSCAELCELSDLELAPLVSPDHSHPRHSEEFIGAADGFTVIVDRLREFVPDGKPCATVWPAADARYFFPRPRPDAFRALFDASADTTVIFYHGNTHAANAAEMRELYAAVSALNENGAPVILLRAGVDHVAFLPPDLAAKVRPHVLELGQILNHRHLPPLMALADMFVQPGMPDAFNDYRFPSKLPEFFAIGRPVILPRTNLGASLRHGEDAYVLDRADAAGIAAAVRALRSDAELRLRLANGATAFAGRRLSWRKSAATLANFYATLARS